MTRRWGWRDIAADLRRRLDRGDWRPGETIPQHIDLAEEYGVSRPTVQRAVTELVAEGLLYSVRWTGTVVAPRPLQLTSERYRAVADPARARPDHGPWEAACAQHGMTGRAEITGVDTVPASPDVAQRLGIAEGAETVRRSRVMWADDRRLQLQTGHYPRSVVDRVPQLAAAAPISGGAYRAIAAAGVTPTRAREEISARLPVSDEAERLDIGDRQPVLTVWRTTYAGAEPVSLVHVVAVAAAVTMTYEDLPLTAGASGDATAPEPAAVAAAVVTGPRGVLVAQRHDRRPPWTLPAGEILPGESPADAAVREVREETGLDVTIVGELGRRVHPQTGRTMAYLAARPTGGDAVHVGDPAELAEVRWVSVGEATELLPGLYEPVRTHLAQTMTET